MNREIKFRAKRTDNGEWVFGSLVKEGWLELGWDDLYCIVTDTNFELHEHEADQTELNATAYSVDPKTISEYTGFKDKNGIDIYELHEINDAYRVIYKAPCYVLQNIFTGDIVPMYEQDKLIITGEYSPMEKD